jgi:hypothetical protein
MTAGRFGGQGEQVVDSGNGSPTSGAVDVALLRAQYLTAFERYRAHDAKQVEHTERGAPLGQRLDEEHQALEDLAALRVALLDALAALKSQIDPSLAAETRDEMIQRSIAKRSQGGLGTSTHRLRLYRPRRIA